MSADYLAGVSGSVTVSQSRTSWDVTIGRHQLSFTRTREARTTSGMNIPPSRYRRTGPANWPIVIGAFTSVSAFGLFVFGAVAAKPTLPYQHARYSLSVPVPSHPSKPEASRSSRLSRKGTSPSPLASSRSSDAGASLSRTDTSDESHIARAMRTGQLEEWSDSDGQRRFLTVGPEHADYGRRCRDLALLVRQADGSSHTRSVRRCAADDTGGKDNLIGQKNTPFSISSSSYLPDNASSNTDDGSRIQPIRDMHVE